MQEREPLTIKEMLYEELQTISIHEEPGRYLDVLDKYEREDLHDRQVNRRKEVFSREQKAINHNPLLSGTLFE